LSVEEIFEIVDQSGRVIGHAPRREVHGNPELIHRSVHVLVLDSAEKGAHGKIFLQKRSADKDIQPGKWDTSVGGHVAPGESVLKAAKREMGEELGITGVDIEFLYSYLWRTDVETELVTTYLCYYNGPIRILRSEIDEGRFWSFAEIESKLASGTFTPNFEEEFSRLKKTLSG
jgi:isopentenyldiphosphate isomerase